MSKVQSIAKAFLDLESASPCQMCGNTPMRHVIRGGSSLHKPVKSVCVCGAVNVYRARPAKLPIEEAASCSL